MVIKEGTMNRDLLGGKVFSVENDTDIIVAAVQKDGITRQYDCKVGCCDNPVCTCGILHMGFSPREDQGGNQPVAPYKVDIDVIRKQVAYKDENKVPKQDMAFAKLLISSLDSADFQFLWQLYFARKNDYTKQAPIDSIEAVFDFQEVEESGLMYAYKDVLPYGDFLQVRLKGKECFIFDQYCLKTKCSCTDATMTFVSVDEDAGTTEDELFTVRVNYRKKQWSTVEDQAIPADVETARSVMESQIPDLYKKLLKRHIQLKGIYAHCKKRHFKQQVQLPTVGRNDPCPCGSGKKYKKCCM